MRIIMKRVIVFKQCPDPTLSIDYSEYHPADYHLNTFSTCERVGVSSLTCPFSHQQVYNDSTLEGITQARFDSWKGCLHNTRLFSSGGCSSGSCIRSMMAWPSLA